MTEKDKVLCYQCPKCEKAAFYLSGRKEDYVNGMVLNAGRIKQILSNREMDMGGYIKCKSCYFPFTTGVLYIQNIKEFDRV